MTSALQLHKVRSGYGPLEILKGISLQVDTGEIVSLIGANGAGKTTTLNSICGVVPLRAGTMSLFGKEITHMKTDSIVSLGVVQVPEGRKLFSDMTVLENLEMGAYLRKDKKQVQDDVEKMCDLFPRIQERQTQLAGSLSGGEQQMVAIARGLMARPKLLLLDEPSLGLAPIIVEKIFETISRVNKEDGVTILLVEQNARLALQVSSRGYVLETGEIFLEGPAQELRDNEEVKKAYLGGH